MKKVTHLQSGGYFAETDTWQAAYDYNGKRTDEPTNVNTNAPMLLEPTDMALATHEKCVCILRQETAGRAN